MTAKDKDEMEEDVAEEAIAEAVVAEDVIEEEPIAEESVIGDAAEESSETVTAPLEEKKEPVKPVSVPNKNKKIRNVSKRRAAKKHNKV